MNSVRSTASKLKLLMDSFDEPSPSSSFPQLSQFGAELLAGCCRLSVVYIALFLLYSHIYSVSLLSQLTLSIILYKSVNESMRAERYCSLRWCLYDMAKMSSQLLGDFLTIPFHLVFMTSERPFVYYQRTKMNDTIFANLRDVLSSYTPTFWHKNAWLQFICIAVDETPFSWFFQKYSFHIKRECITLPDQGLVALDWWCKPQNVVSSNPEQFRRCSFSDPVNRIEYHSKLYYQYDHECYTETFRCEEQYPFQEDTPILVVFPTFAGDSVAAPVRLLCKYFARKNWRVVVYVKRGCGSFTKGEYIPLTTLKTFCLRGEPDYEHILDVVQSRYPSAPKLLLGLSGGGGYIQDILSRPKYKGQFCGGIKIDSGMDWKEEINDLDIRQPFMASMLGQMFDVALTKCYKHKRQHGLLEQDQYYHLYDWQGIAKMDKVKTLSWCVQKYVCPAYGFGDDHDGYFAWAQGSKLKHLHAPLLILDTLNDGMRNLEHILPSFCRLNPNIVHVLNRYGAHCMRREGFFGQNCWLSAVSHAFGECVVSRRKKL